MHCKISVQQVWRPMRRIFQVHWGRMLYLSLLIDSVGHCIRYANIKVFSEPHFPVYEQNPGEYAGKYVSEKTRIFPYFTQSDVFHWLAQKITHHWTRKIYITLKINNCKEIFNYTIVPILLSHFFISWRFLTKKLQLLRTCPFGFLSSPRDMFVFGP